MKKEVRAYVRFYFSSICNPDFCICIVVLKKINYFLGEDRKIIDREPDDEDKEILVSGRFLNKKGKDQDDW